MGVVSALTGKGFGTALGNPWVVGRHRARLPRARRRRSSARSRSRCRRASTTASRASAARATAARSCSASCAAWSRRRASGPFLFGLLGWIATTRNVALGSAAMALYGLGLGTLFFVVGTFAVNLPKAGAWMMGIKWVGGVCLAYMALAYVRDALAEGDAACDRCTRARSTALAGGRAPGHGPRPGRRPRRRRAAQVAHRAPVQADEARVDRPGHRGPFHGPHVVAKPGRGHSDADASAAAAWRGPSPGSRARPTARARAASEHKPLLVDFGASWCGACKELDEKTFPDPRVRPRAAASSRFTSTRPTTTTPRSRRVRRSTARPRACRWCSSSAATAKRPFRFTEFVPPDRFANALAQVPTNPRSRSSYTRGRAAKPRRRQENREGRRFLRLWRRWWLSSRSPSP